MLNLNDTIAAVATPPGEGGVGIVRVSGPAARFIADRLFVPQRPSDPTTFRPLRYGRVVDRSTSETVDDALLLTFRGPNSYTGDDVVEISCHGGPVTLARVLKLVLNAGARHAEPGEFTQRAFLNGRMDLTQAEAVCDLIRARTETQQKLAVRQREGELSRRIVELRHEVVGALAAVEVTIDFSDEVGDLDYSALSRRLEDLASQLGALVKMGERGRIYREGVRLAIVGLPNVGKSSLMNALLREDRAIVTPIAGTTRDTIEETANIRGIPITAIDTAGLRATEDVVERIGVERARAAVESASLVLMVIDAERGWTTEDLEVLREVAGTRTLGVVNKIDLVDTEEAARIKLEFESTARFTCFPISAFSSEGVEDLEAAIADHVTGGHVEADLVVITNARHLHALSQALESVQLACHTAEQGMPPDFISIDLRGALDALGRITGETASDEIIHRIFHDFCVGK